MKKQIQHTDYNGELPLQEKPCTGNVAFSPSGSSGSMIEFAFIIAATMRIMAEAGQSSPLPWAEAKKEAA